MSDNPVVVGTGLTKIGRRWEDSLSDLFAEASRQAIEEAGIQPQAVFVGNMVAGELDGQEHLGLALEDGAGVFPFVPAFKVESACSSGGSALLAGYMAVKSGVYDSALVVGVEKLSEEPSDNITTALAEAADADFEAYYGASFTSLNALLMRSYMKEYNVPRDWLSEIAVMMHKNAVDNPYAQLRKAITVDDVNRSRVIADPIRLLDCSPTGDGAAAILLTKPELAKGDVQVELAGMGVGVDTIGVNGRVSLSDVPATARAARAAFSAAKVEVKDLDVLEVHDAFTIMAALALEDIGVVGKGEGAKFFHEGSAERDGKLPVNPEGGLKARGHPVGATGVYGAVEVVRQLQGKAGKMQVPNAEIGAFHNLGGSGSHAVIGVFKRKR
ncbi:MAG: thiolase domain-containing protein [Thermoprotei archaeon]